LKESNLSAREGDPSSEPALPVALYARVSTTDQNCELQLRELADYAARHGWQVVKTYQDVASGSKGQRPGLRQLMTDTRVGKFRCLLVWKLDRFGRSLVDCLNNIQTLESYGIRFIAVTQGLDSDQRNPASRLLLHVLGAAAEFERSLIRERTIAGQKRYRQDFEAGRVGKMVHSRSGRDLPPHRPRKIFDRDEVVTLRERGLSLRQIASRLGLGLGTVTRTLRERRGDSVRVGREQGGA
jgi:DNA invertase Pin-like site-specific DNA recombinase